MTPKSTRIYNAIYDVCLEWSIQNDDPPHLGSEVWDLASQIMIKIEPLMYVARNTPEAGTLQSKINRKKTQRLAITKASPWSWKPPKVKKCPPKILKNI